jgi:uncharacterized protein YjbI with pentapeptide repeats
MIAASEIRARLAQPWRHGAHADFRGVICNGPLDLAGLVVDGVDFSGAVFPEGLDARQARFDGLAWFGGVTFGAPARFGGASFMNDARFEGTVFAGSAEFGGAEFRGIGRFDDAQFGAGADLSEIACFGNFSMQDVQAEGAVSLRAAEWLGGLWCAGMRLPPCADTTGTQVHGRLWLRGARRGEAPLAATDFEMVFGYAYT